MSDLILSDFKNSIHAVVIGASGGIGAAFVQHLKKQPNVATVHELSRSQTGFDLTDEDSIKSAADLIADRSIHLIIIATGYLGLTPEKSLRDLSLASSHDIFAINCFGPAAAMKYFAPKLVRDDRAVMATLSARVGSISDNHLGGWYAYRASKAALNMFIKTTAIEMARTHKHAAIIGLHPGTVDTNLSKPFQGHVPDGKLFSPEYATTQMLNVINNVQPDKSGTLFAYDGEIIPF